MRTAVHPAKTSPGGWDGFADVDDFVNAVLTELAAMARDGTRPQRSGANREHAKSWRIRRPLTEPDYS
jgi:hypothetical protein